jgi:signal transduction histidine kinase/ActR/RegA family two-component response regulator
MASALSRFTERLRRGSLSVKLAALGATVTATVVTFAFVGLSAEVRANTREVFTAQLARSQRSIQELRSREARQLLFAASIVSRAPQFMAALSTSQSERNAGGGGERQREFSNTASGVLRESLQGIDADLILATDDSGRVFAGASRRGGGVADGTSLMGLDAMRRALDPAAPADSGAMAVLRTDSGYVEAAVYPVVQNGFTLGALVVGRRLDAAFVAGEATRADAEVVLTVGDSVVRAHSGDQLRVTAAMLTPHAGDSTAAVRVGDDEYIVAPVLLGQTQDKQVARLWMLQSLTARVGALTRPMRGYFELYGVLAVILAAFGAASVARSVLGPFQRFVAHMRSGAAAEQRLGKFDAEREAREVRTLNDSFNQLMDSLAARRREIEARSAELVAANVVLTDEINERVRIEQQLRESQAQLRQSQKLEAIGTLAGGIAHDFNNLITVISGYTQLALMRADKSSPEADDLKQVVEASDRAAKLTHQLLAFSRKQVLQPTVLDLGDVVNGMAPMLRRIIGEHILLEIKAETPLARVRADRGQLEQVLLNLAVNARDAMPAGGWLCLQTANAPDGRTVTLTVTDTGTGMPESIRERIFEPFFTTKEPGKGTGLGLSTVYGIISQSGGTISVDSVPDHGTTFGISMPAAESVAVTDAPPIEESDLPTGDETILIVEDAEDVRILARRALQERGYNVLVARNADEALEIAAARHIDVLLTDIVMPHTSGPQLVARYVALHPAPLIVFMSGYADDALAQYELEGNAVFLRKPFTPAILARTIRDVLDSGKRAPRAVDAAD